MEMRTPPGEMSDSQTTPQEGGCLLGTKRSAWLGGLFRGKVPGTPERWRDENGNGAAPGDCGAGADGGYGRSQGPISHGQGPSDYGDQVGSTVGRVEVHLAEAESKWPTFPLLWLLLCLCCWSSARSVVAHHTCLGWPLGGDTGRGFLAEGETALHSGVEKNGTPRMKALALGLNSGGVTGGVNGVVGKKGRYWNCGSSKHMKKDCPVKPVEKDGGPLKLDGISLRCGRPPSPSQQMGQLWKRSLRRMLRILESWKERARLVGSCLM